MWISTKGKLRVVIEIRDALICDKTSASQIRASQI